MFDFLQRHYGAHGNYARKDIGVVQRPTPNSGAARTQPSPDNSVFVYLEAAFRVGEDFVEIGRTRNPVVVLRRDYDKRIVFPRFEKLGQVVCKDGVETCPEFAYAAQKEYERQRLFIVFLRKINPVVVGLVVVNVVLGLTYGELPAESCL